eukprot:CAMPEP_0182915416 /NCGR_PEP_ID=MMETSP0105_2-20130417/316_1 /TAXON_ID=81532 ORGANISM="Acanthoeca-like sp., Strain 10tr" /NCGR_SAMPLE_ID=MMETSP0105_2 /ASSEMBLY_ACC=CAM_ASM_000205 /LENGTH=863 /DNA_ID=CAMNT_0025052283 /DNA_START=14 /DNA_END=2605 /DNA_ORIENTATION=-
MLAALAVVSAAGQSVPDVMNAGGVPYEISNPPGSTANWKGTPGTYSTNFNDNVDGAVEFFDVYGEVQTQYSQVYWTRNLPINLPPELIERFDGKVMAITGYEVDQVTHVLTPEERNRSTTTDTNLGGFACYPACSESDKSVPMYNAYNHHYFGWLTGKDAEVYDLETPRKLPNPTRTGIRDKANTHGFPTNIVFKENPGGEYRKSYHGYPSGFAQLLHSPTQWLVEPMQIDTHNREYGINDEVGYKPTFMPHMVQNNMTNLHSGLSPLIECPCTDRITRRVVETSPLLTSGVCSAQVADLQTCAETVGNLATVVASASVANASEPAGCLMVPTATPGEVKAIFNTAKSSATCAPPSLGPMTWQSMPSTSINCGSKCLPSDAKYGCTGEFQGQCTWDSVEQAEAGCAKYDECKAFMCSDQFSSGKFLCFGRMVTATGPAGKGTTSYIKTYASPVALAGTANLGGLVNLTVAHDGAKATIAMTGPTGVWFGVGFDASSMLDLPYAIIVDGAGHVTERKLANHGPGTELPPSVTVVSSTVIGQQRTVVLTRAVAGKAYTLPTSPGQLDVITAVGSTPTFAYHAQRTMSKIVLLPTTDTACVCQASSTGYFTYMNKSTAQFNGYNCVDEPRSDMLRHGDGTGRNVSNAACHTMTYNGGLRCCAHHNFLTDIEQAPLIPNKTDTYYLKWRYYFQPYTPPTATAKASHKHLHHWVFLIDDSVNDYEEDNANYGHASIGKIEAHLTVGSMGLEDTLPGFKTVMPHVMTPHCHAPSCIREEFWNADTGEIICNITALYGDEAYGSTDAHFNEKNYIAIPPCIFGSQPGLQTPFQLSPATNITAIKYFNNTYRHLGQMAQWTGLVVYDNDLY